MNFNSLRKAAMATALTAALVSTNAAQVAAATVASPDPAVPGDSVTISPDADCAGTWKELANAGAAYGVIVVAWPDGTETVMGPPLPNPATVTVPAGMDAGQAVITVHKGLVDGQPSGSIPACEGAFEIAKDATVPVADLTTATGAAAVAGLGYWAVARTRRPTDHRAA